uniref:Uncharacterized protein n=1 Tax=Globisporangium ultimum (strain ATCC 200006 / CBS 805.95 / DAOM BR144) TaxID=431595 RepID=K3X1D4_GLOUD
MADDEDSGAQNLTYSLLSDEFSSIFQVHPSTGHIRRYSQELDYETVNKYELKIQIQDSFGLSALSTVIVWIIDENEAPQLSSSSTISVSEDAITGTVVGAVKVNDPEGDVTMLAISGGNELGLFAIHNGSIQVKKAGLDYETFPVHTLNVTITEARSVNALQTIATLTVKVLDVNEAPFASKQLREVRENSREGQVVGAPLTATDPDISQKLAFSIQSGNEDNFFVLDAASGQLFVGKGPSDSYIGCFNSLQEVILASSDLSLSPTPLIACSKDCSSYQFMTLFAAAKCYCSSFVPALTEAQVSDIACDSTCSGSTNNTCGGANYYAVYRRSTGLDYEKKNKYSLAIQVQDNGMPSLSTSFEVSISITDVNESPSIRAFSIYVPENANTSVDADSFLVVSDDDIVDSWVLSLVSCLPTSCPFTFDADTKTLLATHSLDFETQHSYLLTFRVTDAGRLSSEITTTVFIMDVNEHPTILSSSFELKENTPYGSPIGKPVVALDQDSGGSVLFSVASQDLDGCIEIEFASGQLYVKNPLCFDYEVFQYDSLSQPVFQAVDMNCGIYRLLIQGVDFEGELGNSSFIKLATAFVDSTGHYGGDTRTITKLLQEQVNARVEENGPTFQVFHVTAEEGSNVSAAAATLRINVPLLRQHSAVELSCQNQAWMKIFDVRSLHKTYNLVVRVRDTSTDALSVEKAFAVALLDVNEPPVLVSGIELAIVENAAAGTLIDPPINSLFFDPEGAKLAITLQNQSVPGTFYYDSSTNRLHVGRAGINFEQHSSHSVVFAIMDGDILVNFNITISVLDANDPPMPQCGHFQVSEAAPVKTVLASSITVLDEDVFDTSFMYRTPNSSAWFSFDDVGRLVLESKLDYETSSKHYFTVEVTDTGGLNGMCVAVVDVLDVDEAPTGSVFYNGSVHQSAAVGHQIVKVSLRDPEGKALLFTFTNSAIASLFSVSDDQFLVVKSPTLLQQVFDTTLVASVIASDGLHDVRITCYITIIQDIPPLECPLTPASFQILENSFGAEVGTVSVVNLNAVSIRFELLGSGSPFQLNETTGKLFTSRVFQLDYEAQSVYQLYFAAYYSDFGMIHCPFKVDVVDQNEPPVCELREVTISENMIGINVWLLQVVAEDQDGTALMYAMDTTTMFYTNSSGSLFARDLSLINYEVASYYDLIVQVSDGVNVVQCPATVNIADGNDCPAFPSQTRFVPENSVEGALVGSPLAVTDEDYSLGASGRLIFSLRSDVFALEAASGQIMVLNSSALDFETQDRFELIVSVTDDAQNPCTTTALVVIMIVDVNEPPSIVSGLSGSVYEFTSASSHDLATPIVTVLAHDPDVDDILLYSMTRSSVSDLFRIDSRSGAIFASDLSAFNYETTNTYNLSIVVSDFGGLSIKQVVEIRVLDVNEAPVFSILSARVKENSNAGSVVLDGLAPTAIDPEGQDVVYSVVSATSRVPFLFSGNQLVVASNGSIDFETRESFQVPVRACDTFAACSYAYILVTVEDVNEPPIVVPSTVSVRENSAAGVLVGSPIIASDPDIGQQLTFEINGGNGKDMFGVISCSGQVYVLYSSSLDYEQRDQYELHITVRDNGSPLLSTSTTIRILVIDENEPPVLRLDYQITTDTRPSWG